MRLFFTNFSRMILAGRIRIQLSLPEQNLGKSTLAVERNLESRKGNFLKGGGSGR